MQSSPPQSVRTLTCSSVYTATAEEPLAVVPSFRPDLPDARPPDPMTMGFWDFLSTRIQQNRPSVPARSPRQSGRPPPPPRTAARRECIGRGEGRGRPRSRKIGRSHGAGSKAPARRAANPARLLTGLRHCQSAPPPPTRHRAKQPSPAVWRGRPSHPPSGEGKGPPAPPRTLLCVVRQRNAVLGLQ